MIDKASVLIDEIRQVKTQYMAEVGAGRRAWPKSIKTRVAELDELGVPAKGVAERTGIPYETIILWRYKRKQEAKSSGFHEVKVTEPKLPVISKSVTVTAPKSEISSSPLTLTTPEGYRIEGLSEVSLMRMIAGLRQGVNHAS